MNDIKDNVINAILVFKYFFITCAQFSIQITDAKCTLGICVLLMLLQETSLLNLVKLNKLPRRTLRTFSEACLHICYLNVKAISFHRSASIISHLVMLKGRNQKLFQSARKIVYTWNRTRVNQCTLPLRQYQVAYVTNFQPAVIYLQLTQKMHQLTARGYSLQVSAWSLYFVMSQLCCLTFSQRIWL